MLKFLPHSTGLTFHDWIDVLLFCPDQDILGNPRLDLNEVSQIHEQFWIGFLASYRQGINLYNEEECTLNFQKTPPPITVIPDDVKRGRGIGAWSNPEYIIVTDEIKAPYALGRSRQKEEMTFLYGHPYWDGLPKYRRLRPFMESDKSLKFLYQLLHQCTNVTKDNTYITCVKKSWAKSEESSREIFNKEIGQVLSTKKVKRIICLGDTSSSLWAFQEGYGVGIHELKFPTFYSSWHGFEWREFRERFQTLVT